MLKIIHAVIIIAALIAAICPQKTIAQGTFEQPAILFNNSQIPTPFGSSGYNSGGLTNPFTSPIGNAYGMGSGFGLAPLVVAPYPSYAIAPLRYGLGYSGFSGNWIGRTAGYGGYGRYGRYGSYSAVGNGGYPGGFGNMPYAGGFGWGGYGGNPFTGAGGLSPFNSTPELGTLQGTSQVTQIAPSKASGNYYQSSTVDTSASGSYYASTATPTQQAAPLPQRREHSGWTSPSGSGDFWGSGGAPFSKDLNSVPWNK